MSLGGLLYAETAQVYIGRSPQRRKMMRVSERRAFRGGREERKRAKGAEEEGVSD